MTGKLSATMTALTKPIYLFADSQLLFWRLNGEPFLASILDHIENRPVSAACIGASNDDNPDFYTIFESAMHGIGVSDQRMIPSSPSGDDLAFLSRADIILLSSGDVEKGWTVFQNNSLDEMIASRYYEGALLLGVSAGAVQIGLLSWSESDSLAQNLFYTFKLVPHIISARDEENDWTNLKNAVRFAGSRTKGIGIPAGGGMIYHPNMSVEPVRYPLLEFWVEAQNVSHSLLYPGDAAEL